MPKPRASETEGPDRGPLLGALLRRCHQVVITRVSQGLTEAGYPGLQPAQNAVLRPLWDSPKGMRSSNLAAVTGITKQSVGAMVDQLEELGHVERVDDPDDKRAKLVRLTKRGRDAGRITRALVRSVEADWARRVGVARVDAVRETLADLLASLDMEA